ncbi:MAG: hypothetical protein ACD_66C00076G0002, partial [uncultured bacterium]
GCSCLKDKRIAILGLAFKAGTDDIRESIGIDYARRLIKDGVDVVVHDTYALGNARAQLSGVEFAESIANAVKGSDAVIITTDAQEYKSTDWKELGELMCQKVIFDGRNVLVVNNLESLGFKYIRVGG